MSIHPDPFAAQQPPSDFADRVVAAMLEERHDRPRRGWRHFGVLGLAAFFIGASAWAGLSNHVDLGDGGGAQLIAPRPAEATAPATKRAMEPARAMPVARPVAQAPRGKLPGARPRAAAPAQEITPQAPRVLHIPLCACEAGVELCGCVE